MSYFDDLRVEAWSPEFKWVFSIDKAADMINQPHEDYPLRVQATNKVIEAGALIPNSTARLFPDVPVLLSIHGLLFSDKRFGGKFRKINVTVGRHMPPKFEAVPRIMESLAIAYEADVVTEESLIEWYNDFETIHPFIDGNGRVCGTIVAVLSHVIFPVKGWMAPLQ